MTRRNSYFPPNLSSGVIPDIGTEEDLKKYRKIAFFLSNEGSTRDVADFVLGNLASVRDENADLVFTDMRKTSPHVLMTEHIAHIGSLVNFMTSNIPILIEDYIINMRGQPVITGLPEFVWVSVRLSEPLTFDYTIAAGRKIKNKSGDKQYTSVYSMTIPAGNIGLESGPDGKYLYSQLYRSDKVGTSQSVAPRELTEVDGAIAYVEEVINWESSFGGRDPERYANYRIRSFQEPEDALLITPDNYITAVENFIGPSTRSIVVSSFGYSKDTNVVELSIILPNGEIVKENTPIVRALSRFLEDRDPNATVKIVEPVVTEIIVDFDISGEAIGDYDEQSMKDSVNRAVGQFSNPLNWEDWGERDNNFNLEKLTNYVKSKIGGIDSIRVSRVSVGGIEKTEPAASFTVSLRAYIGLPKVTTGVVRVTREELL